jgi:hypothetical protein
MFILSADLKELANLDIKNAELPYVYYICYYERFRRYSLVLKIKNREIMWTFAKITSTKGGFRGWGEWDILKVDSLDEIDLSSKRALVKQTKKMYKEFLKKRKQSRKKTAKE